MRRHALPLQILLAFALVLNGIGGAMAGVLVAAAISVPAAMADTNAGTPTAQSGDCDGHAAAAVETMAQQAPASDCHVGGDDCGDSPQCRQACMHASVAMPPQLLAGIVHSRAQAILHPLASGHPAPFLRGLIRPPIA